ncbi:hypothetical protein SESBI_40222 [Sesbania bispinosa]|nr:hypothetical protein SESBI_40221 [Sesbania bispinosa]KAJ1387144.1 hypothetical protein SESBI_40222 [Sesbania bispinosa]
MAIKQERTRRVGQTGRIQKLTPKTHRGGVDETDEASGGANGSLKGGAWLTCTDWSSGW